MPNSKDANKPLLVTLHFVPMEIIGRLQTEHCIFTRSLISKFSTQHFGLVNFNKLNHNVTVGVNSYTQFGSSGVNLAHVALIARKHYDWKKYNLKGCKFLFQWK